MVGVGFNEDLGRYVWVYRDGESSQLPVDGYEVNLDASAGFVIEAYHRLSRSRNRSAFPITTCRRGRSTITSAPRSTRT